MFKNIVNLIEKVDDAAADYSKEGSSVEDAPITVVVPLSVSSPTSPSVTHKTSLNKTLGESSVYSDHLTGVEERLQNNDEGVAPAEATTTNHAEGNSMAESDDLKGMRVVSSEGMATSFPPAAASSSSSTHTHLLMSRQLAEALVSCETQSFEISQLRSLIQTLNEDVAEKTAFLRRLRLACPAEHPVLQSMPELDSLLFEMDAMMAAISAPKLDAVSYNDTIRTLEQTVRLRQEAYNHVKEANIRLRQQLLEEASCHEAEKEVLTRDWGRLSAEAERCAVLSKELERRKDDAQAWWNKQCALQTALRESSKQSEDLAHQIASLQRVVILRDEELSALRLSSAHQDGEVRPIASTTVYHAMDKTRYGVVVQRAATMVDGLTFRIGRILRRHAYIRLAVIAYVVVLHVYMFHVVSLTVHSMPHVGDDVHDHLRSHMK